MDYKNINDYEQLYLISEKDENASKLVFEKYKPIIYNIAYKHLQNVSHFNVEIDELVQEGYVGLSKAINSYKDNLNTSFYTFAIVCISRQIKSFCKHFYTKKQLALNNKISIDDDDKKVDLQDSIYKNSNPEFYLDNSNYNDLCIDFKHTLTPYVSSVFELKSNGFTTKEIANLLGVSTSMVEKAVYEIRKKGSNYLNN